MSHGQKDAEREKPGTAAHGGPHVTDHGGATWEPGSAQRPPAQKDGIPQEAASGSARSVRTP